MIRCLSLDVYIVCWKNALDGDSILFHDISSSNVNLHVIKYFELMNGCGQQEGRYEFIPRSGAQQQQRSSPIGFLTSTTGLIVLGCCLCLLFIGLLLVLGAFIVFVALNGFDLSGATAMTPLIVDTNDNPLGSIVGGVMMLDMEAVAQSLAFTPAVSLQQQTASENRITGPSLFLSGNPASAVPGLMDSSASLASFVRGAAEFTGDLFVGASGIFRNNIITRNFVLPEDARGRTGVTPVNKNTALIGLLGITPIHYQDSSAPGVPRIGLDASEVEQQMDASLVTYVKDPNTGELVKAVSIPDLLAQVIAAVQELDQKINNIQ